jgi:hypothetical protein
MKTEKERLYLLTGEVGRGWAGEEPNYTTARKLVPL